MRSSVAPSPVASHAPYEAVIGSYCAGCHNQRLRTGGLAFDALDMSDVGTRADVWEKVLQKLRMGAMPPPGRAAARQTDARRVHRMARDRSSISSAVAQPNPGRTGSVHRLNRFEYQNAVRDLLGLDIDVDSLLPVDDADKNGFDNVANDAVGLADAAGPLPVGGTEAQSSGARHSAGRTSDGHLQSPAPARSERPRRASSLPFGSRGGFAVQHYFPVDGEYIIKVRLRRQLYDYVVGLGSPHRIEVRVDGERVLAVDRRR